MHRAHPDRFARRVESRFFIQRPCSHESTRQTASSRSPGVHLSSWQTDSILVAKGTREAVGAAAVRRIGLVVLAWARPRTRACTNTFLAPLIVSTASTFTRCFFLFFFFFFARAHSTRTDTHTHTHRPVTKAHTGHTCLRTGCLSRKYPLVLELDSRFEAGTVISRLPMYLL